MKSAFLALFLSMAVAGTAGAEDLLGVYRDAVDNDPAIREANANRRATREARPQAWSALLPQINGAVQATRTESDETQPISFRDPVTGIVTIIPVARTGTTDSTGYSL